jgi:AcrR family transcriptional regulator
MDDDAARTAVLDAAESLFYARGIQAVGMDQIRNQAQVSLKRMYTLFPGKDEVLESFLRRRDERWQASLRSWVDTVPDPRDKLLAVFDWLAVWFTEPGFRGCAWINAFGELGALSATVRELTRAHKGSVRAYLADLAEQAALPDALGAHLFLLVEGAIVTAGIFADADPLEPARIARTARTAAANLIGAATGEQPDGSPHLSEGHQIA